MENNEKLLKNYYETLYVGGYPKKTIDSYLYHCKRFLTWIGKDSREVTQKDINIYKGMLRRKGLSHATINLVNQSLKSFFVRYMKRRFYGLKSMRKQEKYTGVVNKNIILEVISKTRNLKHKLLLEVLYSTGARIGEAVKLKKEDLHFHNNKIIVRQGKGQKDRPVMLSEMFKRDYSKYLRRHNPKHFIFEGRKGPITVRAGQEIVRQLFKKHAGLDVHPHMLRASYATHLYEDDVKPRIIQKFMGHKDKRTTECYFAHANLDTKGIKSPIDT